VLEDELDELSPSSENAGDTGVAEEGRWRWGLEAEVRAGRREVEQEEEGWTDGAVDALLPLIAPANKLDSVGLEWTRF
jgi:hypothetical protein